MKLKTTLLIFSFVLTHTLLSQNQSQLAPTPPMGFMTWNYFGLDIHENDIKTLADAMVETGLRDLGYNYIFIDDGWQGGRDNKNNIIADPAKFPSGMKSLVDYVHTKGMKIGIYSDAAPLTCGGYTASLNFEEQDAKTFAAWGFDYLKYDYCGAPADWQTAISRYERMAKALQNSGRDIAFGICEWGDRSPWLWARKAGGHLWRTTADVRDKWKSHAPAGSAPHELHGYGAGILDILEINAGLDKYAGPNGWNDPDMLVVGLYGKKGAPSTGLGGTGCTDTEYQSQMSLWCLMAAPLMITCDVRNMNEATKRILTNKDIIAIDQDPLGIQAERKLKTDLLQIFVKPLSNGDVALGILNTSDQEQTIEVNPETLGIFNKRKAKDLWSGQTMKTGKRIKVKMAAHETKVFRLSE
ncbi:MAG TPA: glycoside hydrolase family 27 protein [Paludibacteraceae bacterium]|nr:glycoside hydrolase family 27 protein [Paludibacteraceae bacterium]